MANPYLTVQELSYGVGDKMLFENISFGISEGQHVGLIASNGVGKTSLLNLLTGRDQPDGGSIVYRKGLKVGYLEQSPSYPGYMTVKEACLWKCPPAGEVHEEPQERERRIEEALTRLDITDHDKLIAHLSGGQLKRVALANVLILNPDLLILDEPTNHLDVSMIEWLEEYLGRRAMTLLMVTHDRFFLDRVCDIILELENRQLYTYRGNYAYYLEKRQQRIDANNAEIARANNLYRTELEWMRRMPQARGHKARYREEAFYDCSALESITIPDTVTTLGQGAFGNCTALAEVTLGTGLKAIPYYTFAGDVALAELLIPYGVEAVRAGAFDRCANLRTLFVPSSVTIFTVEADEFEKSYDEELILYVEAGISSAARTVGTSYGWDVRDGMWSIDRFFPDEILPEELPEAHRSCALRIGAYSVIRHVMQEYKLPHLLGRCFEKDCGLLLDLVSYLIVDEENAGQYYPDFAFNHPLFSDGHATPESPCGSPTGGDSRDVPRSAARR